MALLMLSGFDLFGPVNSASANVAALLTQGEWTSTTGTGFSIVAPLSANGFALNITGNCGATKTLAANYTRLIGGFHFSATLGGNCGLSLLDAATAQVSVNINTTGTISVRNGTVAGTVLGTSSASITANTTHHCEFDITLANSPGGAAQIWLDGVSVLNLSSIDTTATANTYANSIQIGGVAGSITFDNLYLLDTSGPAPLNAPLLTSPRIETQFPSSDGVVQFAVGAAVLGSTVQRATGGASTNNNQLRLRAVTPGAACTINSISFLAGPTGSATINLRPVVYASSGGVPGALLGSGPTATATTASTAKTLPLTSGVSLVAGTQYFIGLMCDVSVSSGLSALSSVSDDLTATSTFASGAPSTAPAMTAAASTVIWANITAPNFVAVSQSPAQGSSSYVYDATVGHEDLYSFPALSVVPSAIYATAIKASVSKSDAGAKTVSLRQKSGSTYSSGGAQAPGTSFAWLTSLYPTDPNGGGAWTKAALDAAQGGVRVES